jgi:hypothetical protein
MNLNELFYVKNKDTYPPFKSGLYLEEYFLQNVKANTKRKYIPCLWTNFQIEGWFQSRRQEMQMYLNEWVENNPSSTGYFTVVQYDDAVLLDLPKDTVVYGSCSGDIPIPLIYEDNNFTLENTPTKTFQEKNILCSFVGTLTHPVRNKILDTFANNNLFVFKLNGSWSPVVSKNSQDLFVNTTIDSKFAFAPRGYGRSSFRFFEIFKLKSVPIYVWDDIEWLPFKNKIDYSKLCISINVNSLDKLEDILNNITEKEYQDYLNYYDEVKEYFTLPGMTQQIISEI